MSEKGLQSFVKWWLLPNLKGTTLIHCDYYLIGKKQWVVFVRNATKKGKQYFRFGLLGVCGPINVKTIDGASYFVTFINDALRFKF